MFDPGGRGGELHPQRNRLRGHDLEALEQRRVAFGELPGRRQRLREWEQQLDALMGGSRSGEETQRARRTSGRPPAGARSADCAPASRSTAIAAASPWRAERST